MIDILSTMINYINTYWIIIIVEFIAGFGYYLFNEFEDRSIKSQWDTNVNFLNTNKSWKNKWKLDYKNRVIPYKYTPNQWYYFRVYPRYEERFVYSSTILVGITDGEHLFQLLKNLFILLGIGIINPIFMLIFLTGRLTMSLIKEAIIKWLR